MRKSKLYKEKKKKCKSHQIAQPAALDKDKREITFLKERKKMQEKRSSF